MFEYWWYVFLFTVIYLLVLHKYVLIKGNLSRIARLSRIAPLSVFTCIICIICIIYIWASIINCLPNTWQTIFHSSWTVFRTGFNRHSSSRMFSYGRFFWLSFLKRRKFIWYRPRHYLPRHVPTAVPLFHIVVSQYVSFSKIITNDIFSRLDCSLFLFQK